MIDFLKVRNFSYLCGKITFFFISLLVSHGLYAQDRADHPNPKPKPKHTHKIKLSNISHSQIKSQIPKNNELENQMNAVSKSIEGQKKQFYRFGENPEHTSSKGASDLIEKQREQLNHPWMSMPTWERSYWEQN